MTRTGSTRHVENSGGRTQRRDTVVPMIHTGSLEKPPEIAVLKSVNSLHRALLSDPQRTAAVDPTLPRPRRVAGGAARPVHESGLTPEGCVRRGGLPRPDPSRSAPVGGATVCAGRDQRARGDEAVRAPDVERLPALRHREPRRSGGRGAEARHNPRPGGGTRFITIMQRYLRGGGEPSIAPPSVHRTISPSRTS